MLKKDTLPLDPPAPLDEIHQEQATLTETPLSDYVNQVTLRFILGQRALTEWDAYVSEVQGKGVQTFLDLINGAREEYARDHG